MRHSRAYRMALRPSGRFWAVRYSWPSPVVSRAIISATRMIAP